MLVLLCGGVGGARMARALAPLVSPGEMTIVANTGDDIEMWGLHVSPDLDIIVYTLAGKVDDEKGWGLAEDTFSCLGAMRELGEESWFNLGDRDLATCLFRTRELARGRTLSEVTRDLCLRFGVETCLLPMSDDPVATMVETEGLGEMHFEHYLIRHGAGLTVRGIRFAGSPGARPAPGLIAAIEQASAVVIAPSNPLVSVGPILSVAGVREALVETRAPVVAVSPLIGGRTVKGPADRMLGDLGHEVSPVGIARLYHDFLDGFVIDSVDRSVAGSLEGMGLRVAGCRTLMSAPGVSRELGEEVLALAEACRYE